MEVTEVLHKSRVDLDKLLVCIERFKVNRKVHEENIGREVSMSYTSLQMGRMWLGEVLNSIGEDYPYKGTNDAKTPEQIAKAVDTYEGDVNKRWEEGNAIDNLGTLRKAIDSVLDNVHNEYLGFTMKETVSQDTLEKVKKVFHQNQSYMSAYTHIKESRMILGVAMGKIRDNHANKAG